MKLRTYLSLAFIAVALLSIGIIDGLGDARELPPVATAALILGIVAIAIVAGLLVSRHITRPLAQLVREVKEYGEGDFAHRSSVGTPREVAELADAFNHMAQGVAKELADRRRVEEHLDRSRKQFRDLSAHLQTVREDERARIARDIHDDLGQCLTTLKLDLALLYQDTPESAQTLREMISEMTAIVDGTIRSVRRIISELRPRLLDDLGLTAAIEWHAADFQKRTGIPVSLSIYPREIILDQERSTVVFRILQEALVNVARHAGATAVTVSLTDIDGTVEFKIEDNGRGITPEETQDSKSFGLMGIRERAETLGGHAAFTGRANEGTAVVVSFTTTDEEPR
jgi:signal transduction histidine kinase